MLKPTWTIPAWRNPDGDGPPPVAGRHGRAVQGALGRPTAPDAVASVAARRDSVERGRSARLMATMRQGGDRLRRSWQRRAGPPSGVARWVHSGQWKPDRRLVHARRGRSAGRSAGTARRPAGPVAVAGLDVGRGHGCRGYRQLASRCAPRHPAVSRHGRGRRRSGVAHAEARRPAGPAGAGPRRRRRVVVQGVVDAAPGRRRGRRRGRARRAGPPCPRPRRPPPRRWGRRPRRRRRGPRARASVAAAAGDARCTPSSRASRATRPRAPVGAPGRPSPPAAPARPQPAGQRQLERHPQLGRQRGPGHGQGGEGVVVVGAELVVGGHEPVGQARRPWPGQVAALAGQRALQPELPGPEPVDHQPQQLGDPLARPGGVERGRPRRRSSRAGLGRGRAARPRTPPARPGARRRRPSGCGAGSGGG